MRASVSTPKPGLAPRGATWLCLSPSLFASLTPASLLLFLVLPGLAAASTDTWAIPAAVLKFRIEADPNRPPVPSIHLSGLKAKRGPSALRNPDPSGWSGTYYRLDGQVYKRAAALSCPEAATYRHNKDYRRFVALVGLSQSANSSGSVSFEVYADDKKLHTSTPVDRNSVPAGIDVRLPANAKEIRLVTVGSDLRRRRHAYWVNAGFVTKRDHPRVGHAVLPTCGYDPSEHEVAVYTFNGIEVGSKMLRSREEDRVAVLFFAGHGWSSYDVYLVPKGKHQAQVQAWEPDAGLVLETRRADKRARAACKDLPGLRKVWNDSSQTIGCTMVNSLHHGYPVHPRLIASADRSIKDGMALYRYSGFFEADRAGQYTFSTASNWASHLLVNGKAVVSWPGEHDHRPGMRGQKAGRVALEPGVHRIEYLNFSPYGRMFTLAAWKPPGGKLGVMTRGDFPSVRRFVLSAAESDPSAEGYVGFTWEVLDDWRLDRDKAALILMRFRAVCSADSGDREYRWLFGDGTVEVGQIVEHVFSRTGRYAVTLQATENGQVVGQMEQSVKAGTRAEKIWVDPRDRNAFEREVSATDLRKLPLRELVDLHLFSDGVQEERWSQATREALVARAGELIGHQAYHALCLDLVEYLRWPGRKDYGRALAICTELQEKTPEGSQIKQKATVLAAELLVRSLGRYDQALRLLNPARWKETQDKAWETRLGLARAEALLGLGQMEELGQQIEHLRDRGAPSDAEHRGIKHAGLLRRAWQLAKEQADATQLDSATDTVLTVLLEEPEKLLSPRLNLVRLDLHLARGESAMALHLARRVANLDLAPYDRAQVLTRHVKAACAAGDLDAARESFDALAQIAPDSPEALEARATIVKAVTRTQGQP